MQDSFVSLFLEFTKEFESPTSFWKWSAYGAVAATLRTNCSIKWGTSNLYPNLFILLLADSAAYRKDAGPELVEELLKENAHTKVISGRASFQGIIDELSQDIGNKKTGIPLRGGSGIIIAKEFTAFFVEDPQLIQMLTEGYAYAADYEYTLRGGKTRVKDRCINLLGGSNETLLRDMYNERASYGGLLRRTCLIKPDKRRPANPLIDGVTHIDDTKKKQLLLKLNVIKNLKGQFVLTDAAKQLYREWYTDLYNSYEKIEDKTGFLQGVHSLIVKLAMVLAANDETMQINESIIKLAINEILSLKENYMAYAMSSGKHPQANLAATILQKLWMKCNSPNGHPKGLKKHEILFEHWNEISSEDLDKLIQTLEAAGMVMMIPQGSEPSWELTQKAKSIWLNNQKVQGSGATN